MRALLLLLIPLVVPAQSQALLHNVIFTVQADPSDPIYAGQTAEGHFFCDELGPMRFGAYTGFTFAWAGYEWNDGNSGVIFYPTTEWAIGGYTPNSDRALGTGTRGDSPDEWDMLGPDFALYASLTDGFFVYKHALDGVTYSGSFLSWRSVDVPEAPVLALLPLGLLPLLGGPALRGKSPRPRKP